MLMVAHSASAEKFSIAGREIELMPPPGWCRLDPERTPERLAISLQEQFQGQANQIIMVYVRCDELTRNRAENSMLTGFIGVISAIKQQGQVKPMLGISRLAFVQRLAQEMPKLDLPEVAQSNFDRVLGQGNIRPSFQKPTLTQDENGLYLAVQGAMNTRGASGAVINTVNAITLINALPIAMSIGARADQSAVDELVAQQKANITTLIQANAEYDGWYASSFLARIDWSQAGMAGVYGAIIGGLGTLAQSLYRRWRRKGDADNR